MQQTSFSRSLPNQHLEKDIWSLEQRCEFLPPVDRPRFLKAMAMLRRSTVIGIIGMSFPWQDDFSMQVNVDRVGLTSSSELIAHCLYTKYGTTKTLFTFD